MGTQSTWGPKSVRNSVNPQDNYHIHPPPCRLQTQHPALAEPQRTAVCLLLLLLRTVVLQPSSPTTPASTCLQVAKAERSHSPGARPMRRLPTQRLAWEVQRKMAVSAQLQPSQTVARTARKPTLTTSRRSRSIDYRTAWFYHVYE